MHKMRQGTARVVAILLVWGLVAPSARGAGPADWPAVLASSVVPLPVAAGVEYRHVSLATSDGPLDLHHLLVDLRNPAVHLGVTVAHDQLISDDETVSSMAARAGAIAGINADYFDIHQSGMPLNIVISNGQLLRSPWRFVALTVGRDGAARIIRYRWTGNVVTETGETQPLESFNAGLPQNGITVISNVRGYGAPPPDAGARQTVAELSPADPSAAAPGGRYFVKQIWPQQAFYAPFPQGEIILLGRGAGADWIQRRLTAGASLTVNLTTDPDWHEAQVAVGGGPILVDGGQIVEDTDPPAAAERNIRYPAAAVGISPDGHYVTFVEADGRQPWLSIGLTRPQLASYMQRQGAYQAMAFDSGGSAEMVVRMPGQPQVSVVNSPSDGQERPVADAVLVYTTATPGPPVRILVNNNQPLILYPGARVTPPTIGVDAQGNPVPLAAPVQFAASGGLLRVDGLPARGPAPPRQSAPQFVFVGGDGTVVGGSQPADGTVTAQSGAASGSVTVSVVTRLARLVVSPESVGVGPGESAPLRVSGLDSGGRLVALPPEAVAWRVDPPSLGIVQAPGTFVAGTATGAGVLTARLAGATADVRVSVGGPQSRLIPAFEEQASFRAYPPQTVTGDVSLVSTPSHDNRQSVRLQFHLDGQGSRAAYVETDLPMPGQPTGVSMWVYGDGDGVWLRGAYTDAKGDRGTVTLARQVDWQGWKQLTASLPSGIDYPIRWTYVYVVETDPTKTPSGEIYLSGLRALYGH
ncbi:MAG TPA: phosphodiester glycosidase family protein [bacterium]|nr:phosphodiester glycosidase family protein [bacterium]